MEIKSESQSPFLQIVYKTTNGDCTKSLTKVVYRMSLLRLIPIINEALTVQFSSYS